MALVGELGGPRLPNQRLCEIIFLSAKSLCLDLS